MQAQAEKVMKVLGEPFGLDFSENVRKIRINLLIVSTVAIALVLGEIRISPATTFAGFSFEGLTPQIILKALLLLDIYMLLHFAWNSLDTIIEWVLRLSGTRTAYVTVGILADSNGDYPSDPRQSTLYNWWKNEAQEIGNFGEVADNLRKKAAEWDRVIAETLVRRADGMGDTITISNFSTEINILTAAIEKAEAAITSQRIPASLKRFDSVFQLCLRSQNLRFLILELGFPIVMGIIALVLLIQQI